MQSKQQANTSLYTQEVLEFAAVGVKTAALLEQATEQRALIEGLLRLLPQLYLCTLQLPSYLYSPEEDFIPEAVTEDAYERVRLRLASSLGEADSFLSSQSEEMQYSDTPLAAFVSEYLADVYQHIGNLLGILRDENEQALPDAIGRCLLYFHEYWGAHLLEALTALHHIHTKILQEDTDDAYEDEQEEIYDYESEEAED